MEIKKTDKKIKCDVPGCKNLANYYFEFRKNFLSGNMYVCKECLNDLYTCIGKEIVPQSIKNVYKKSGKGEEK